MKICQSIIFLLLVGQGLVHSQEPSASKFHLNPTGTNFAPLKGNTEEPRVGVFKFLDESQMKVDIGSTIDLVSFEDPEAGIRLTAGIDFMAYVFTTGAQGLRLQVDAEDGLFGGNISFSQRTTPGAFLARLRFLHHSAHYVDGHYDETTQSWIDGRAPIPITKDFGDLVGAFRGDAQSLTYRVYAGIGYATLVRPAEYERWSALAGGELAWNIGSLLGDEVNLYCVYNISLQGTPAYAASHEIQAGIKLGKFYGKGASVYAAWYGGPHMFGEYYDQRLSTVALGFAVDVF